MQRVNASFKRPLELTPRRNVKIFNKRPGCLFEVLRYTISQAVLCRKSMKKIGVYKALTNDTRCTNLRASHLQLSDKNVQYREEDSINEMMS